MRSIFSLIATLPVCITFLSGCSTHMQDKAALEFDPIYPSELDIPIVTAPTGGIYSEAKGGLFATDKRATVVGDILTVNLSESFSATKAQTASSSKSDSFDITMPVGLPNIVTGGFSSANALTSGIISFEPSIPTQKQRKGLPRSLQILAIMEESTPPDKSTPKWAPRIFLDI